MTYWQIAAGSDQRDYAAEFLKYGMAFVGGDKQIAAMRQIAIGDKVILKRGMSTIVAAGTVVERDGKFAGDASKENPNGRHWLLDFDGWQLPAYVYVDWHAPEQVRDTKGLTRAAMQQCGVAEIQGIADDIIATVPRLPIDAPPQSVEALTDGEMLEHLIWEGLRPSAAAELTSTLQRIRLLSEFYYYKSASWSDVGEHEARTFLIIPFLLAIGWSEQKIKIELGISGGRVDIACFCTRYQRNNEECVLLLESKGFSQGLDYAHEQGKRYAEQFRNCQVVVTSNGYCYKAYPRKTDGAGFEDKPKAYLNLIQPAKCYPLDPGISGGKELLSCLLPRASSHS